MKVTGTILTNRYGMEFLIVYTRYIIRLMNAVTLTEINVTAFRGRNQWFNI